MDFRPIGRLSKGQVDCLQLVHEHLTSKEIAARLGISPHTVDQRIRIAMRLLNVPSRIEAARLIMDDSNPGLTDVPPAKSVMLSRLMTPAEDATRFTKINEFTPPFATRRCPRNTLTIAQRLLWIIGIAFGAMASTAIYLAGLESFSRMIAK